MGLRLRGGSCVVSAAAVVKRVYTERAGPANPSSAASDRRVCWPTRKLATPREWMVGLWEPSALTDPQLSVEVGLGDPSRYQR